MSTGRPMAVFAISINELQIYYLRFVYNYIPQDMLHTSADKKTLSCKCYTIEQYQKAL